MMTSHNGVPQSSDVIDLAQINAEIQEEIRRRRASGELPANLERELDLEFARFAPVGAIGDDFEQVMARAEQRSLIDVMAPIDAAKPGVSFAKRAVRKTVRWYIRFIAEQLSGFANAITKAVRLLERRVDKLEEGSSFRVPGDVIANSMTTRSSNLFDAWVLPIVEVFEHIGGRVLHADCGEGKVVASLNEAGVDAYGVDSSDNANLRDCWQQDSRLVDMRSEDVIEHLSKLPDASLGGLVLSGCTDYLPVGKKFKAAQIAAAKLVAGAHLVILSSTPNHWRNERSSLDIDLAQGSPLHADTWKALLQQLGFVVQAVEMNRDAKALDDIVGEGDATDKIRGNFAQLNDLLYGPTSYLLTATLETPTVS